MVRGGDKFKGPSQDHAESGQLGLVEHHEQKEMIFSIYSALCGISLDLKDLQKAESLNK